jgi:DNA-binding transcriptional MocR family regulator
MSRSSPDTSENLVARTASELQAQMQAGSLPAGTRLPSVRALARERRISPFSAAEVYNTLVAIGVVEARSGVGYFVAGRRPPASHAPCAPEFTADSVWERRREASHRAIRVDAGCGWLPADWLQVEGLRAALRALARQSPLHAAGYGNPLGLHALRAQLCTLLQARGIAAREDQVLLTAGASQALDLVVREMLQPGDTAVVEDPAYPPVFELLKHRGVRVLAVARTQNGPDIPMLERILRRRRVRCMFTNTTCHNPTGTTTSLVTAHRLLELADRHGMTVIEDDSFADLAPKSSASLASLDELKRVVYVSSFSKTISPSLRAGYLVATPALAQQLARVKVISSLGSSELLERLALGIVSSPHYRRHLNRLRQRLDAAHQSIAREFAARRVELGFALPAGLFLWAKLPSTLSVSTLWRNALEQGVLLAPGELFRADGKASPYWRFNVAHCESPELFRFLDKL